MAIKGSATITLTQYRDTQSVTRYYKLVTAGSSAPAKPTTKPPSSDWSDSEPACDISKTLYFCDLTIFSNGEWEYSTVSKSSSYEAAKEAYNKAQSAQDGINNLEIGARNLALSSLDFDIREIIYSTGTGEGVEIIEYDDRTAIKFTGENTKDIMGCYLITPYTVTVEEGVITDSNFDDDTFIISFDYKCESSLQTTTFQLRLFSYDDSTDSYVNAGRIISTNWPKAQLTATSNWKRAKTGVLNINNPIALYSTGTALTGTFVIGIGYVNNPGVAFEMSKIKFEKGAVATDWTQAPEDVDAGIDNVRTKADNAQTSIDNLEIGGRNLVKRENIIAHSTSFSKIDGYEYTQLVGKGAGIKFPAGMFTEDTEYVLSFKFQKVSGTLTSIAGHCTAFETRDVIINGESFSQGWTTTHEIEDSEAIQTCVVYLRRYTASENSGTDNNLYIQPERSRYHTSNDITIKYWDIKIEKGNRATDWTPAPEDIDSRTKVLEAASAKELVRNGFAEFTNDPSLTLGKKNSAYKVFITDEGIFLQKNSADIASLAKESSSEETTLRADNARLANVKFRSATGGGKLGIVAQSNGHVSLKEI